jgi:predicted component of type VI protein secretion system
MEELIRKKCEEYDLTPDLLTPDELEDLRSEIEREQKGEQLLDSVLDNPELQSRRIKKEIEEESK